MRVIKREVAGEFKHTFSPLMEAMFESFEAIREAKEELDHAKEQALGGWCDSEEYCAREQASYNSAVDEASENFLKAIEGTKSYHYLDNGPSAFITWMNKPMSAHPSIAEALAKKGFEYEYVGDMIEASGGLRGSQTYSKFPQKVKAFINKMPNPEVGDRWVSPSKRHDF